MKNLITNTLIILGGLSHGLLSAEQISFSSPITKVQLVELYTSQGCSSCPPAEHKLSQLVRSPKLWSEIVPIAFHVDYWDYLGWKDLYSDSKNTRKQQQHRILNNISSIYTPGFVVNGKEWRGFFRGNNIPTAQPINTGKLQLTWEKNANNVNMNFNNLSKQSPSFCHFALLSFDKISIKAGENRGLELQQDFSSISSQTKGIEFKNDHYICSASLENLNHIANKQNNKKLALIGWVTTKNEQPIQAVGGWL